MEQIMNSIDLKEVNRFIKMNLYLNTMTLTVIILEKKLINKHFMP